MIARKKIGIETPIKRDEEARVVERPSVPLGREEAEREAEQRREEHRPESKLDRRRETIADLLGDRTTRRDARAEIAGADRLEVAPVLLVERVVEAVLVTNLRDRLRRGPLPEERLGR